MDESDLIDYITALKAELEREKSAVRWLKEGRDVLKAENAKLREALKAAQAVLNQLQCYSTGTAVMAEDEVVELFGKYSDLADGFLGGDTD